MVDIKYAVAYSEVLEILKYIPIEDYNKIPKDKIELFKTYADREYDFKYNPNRTLDEQNVSKIAKGIIAIFFRDYWATETQREKIIAKQKYDRMQLEEKKKEKYNPDDIFNSCYKNSFTDNTENHQELSLVETTNMKWYKKIWKFVKELFVR